MDRLLIAVLATAVGALCAVTAAQAQDDPTAVLARLQATPAFQARLTKDAPQPSGDALFDAYTAEIWRRNAPASYLGQGILAAGSLPDDVLAEWESRYGTDPRYWELRWFSAQLAERAATETAPYTGPEPADFLRQAVARGTYRAETLYGLLLAEAALQRMEGGERFWDVPPREFKAGWEAVLLPLADRFVAEFPQYAEGWYALGQLQLARGDRPAGLAALRQGNAAPDLQPLLAFPEQPVVAALLKGQFLGSRYVVGMLAWGFSDLRTAVDFVAADHVREIRLAAEANLDFAELQVVHDWGARIAQREWFHPMRDSGQLSRSVALAADLLVKRPQDFTEAQRQNLVRVIRDNSRLTERRLRLFGAMTPMPDELLPRMFKPGLIDEAAGLVNTEVALALVLKLAADPAGFRAEWLEQDLGWGLHAGLAEGKLKGYFGELREDYMLWADNFAQWDWSTMEFVPTAEDLERERAFDALMQNLDTMSEEEVMKAGEEILAPAEGK